MSRRILFIFVLVAYANVILGCTSTYEIAKKDLDHASEHPRIIASVEMLAGNELHFDRRGGVYDSVSESIVGKRSYQFRKGRRKVSADTALTIPLSQITRLRERRYSETKTILLMAAGLAVLAIVAVGFSLSQEDFCCGEAD